jgi:transcriptional regulator with XRE-family HTH domain
MARALDGLKRRTNRPMVSIGMRARERRKAMAIVIPKPSYEPMADTMRRARTLLRMNQFELSMALEQSPQAIGQIEQTRSYPSRELVDRFAELFEVNLEVYAWARDPANADSLPGLLGLVPLHIVRLYERRLVDAAVRSGRSRPIERKSSFEDLPSIV